MLWPLTEVATVRDTSSEERNWARLNGVPAVRISIQKQPDANTVAVVDGVAARRGVPVHAAASEPSIVVRSLVDYRTGELATVGVGVVNHDSLVHLIIGKELVKGSGRADAPHHAEHAHVRDRRGSTGVARREACGVARPTPQSRGWRRAARAAA